MGQVFTWDAVQSGRVPTLGAFSRVLGKLRKEIVYEKSIVAAVACGSVIREDHNVRSDVDCVVFYDPTMEFQAFAYMQEATRLAALEHVPLAFNPCDIELALTKMHHIGPSFLQHVTFSARSGGLLKGDPTKLIKQSVAAVDELEAFLRMKMHSLQEDWAKALTFSEADVAYYLQKLLEAPIHTARKSLAHGEHLKGDSKIDVQLRYADHMPSDMIKRLQTLIALDNEYTAMLHRNLKHPDETAYRALLDRIFHRSEEVLGFMRANLLLTQKKSHVSIRDIQAAVCAYYEISLLDLISNRRPVALTHARHMAMYLCKKLTLKSLPEIGRHFGGKDHSTVTNGVDNITRDIAEKKAVEDEFRKLWSMLT